MASLSWWLFYLQLLLISGEVLAGVPALIIFGDSTVDTGNNDYIPTIARSNFRPYGRDFKGGNPTGRFSNGRLAIDFISEVFGLPPTVPAYLDPSYSIKDFQTGVSFASAATGYDNATSDMLSVIPLWQQLEYFKEYMQRLKSFQGDVKSKQTLDQSLYIISMGTNDFLENYYSFQRRRSSEFTIEEYQNFLISISEKFVRDLYDLGARKIDVTGIPPMGCLPLERALEGDRCNEEHNVVAMEFNGKLEGLVEKMKGELGGLNIVFVDVYRIFQLVLDRPTLYGFETASRGCCGTGFYEMGYVCNRGDIFTCSDANKYIFWDAFHPTERMYDIIADHAMNSTLHIFL